MSKTGRPREFSVDAALDKAVEVFYVKGYEAATLDDLTAAMGIQRPSLYSAFGNKETLFLRAIERYRESYVRSAQATLSEEANGKKAMERFLAQTAECHIKSNGLGCLIVNSSVDCQVLQASICDRIRQIHTQNEEMIYRRLERAVADGDLTRKTDIRGLAQFYNGVIQGMAVLARGQNSLDAVRSMAVFAMKAWPDS
ncbi:HTH-type transcriptional repressor ComR [Acaryochloris thomasi RCC1774]|uniref:HTH-type transcriptional repressor ComR n=1 Tax=Acaryochloris thomasi RCC1774 TaxID=1764569 RepID=A0A2W1JJ86_9CYAN|nr:TetR/AcrR family transcriptional regulator [Acaryochloris thomasi]PZD73306.1 HTH-type transcriptional repressor ComR [Acaryochloris thomasi RCC1774]